MVDVTETMGGPLEDVRAFCMVVELGTISAAARVLGETKGGVSRRLSRLERLLGVALLARTPRSVTPTEEGSAFCAKAREGLLLLDEASELARDSHVTPRGHLRVTAPVDLGSEWLPELVVRFQQQYPAISMELLLTDNALDLAANQIDLALRATGGDLPAMGYVASRMATVGMGLYASPDWLASWPALSMPEDLHARRLVLPLAYSQGHRKLQLTDAGGRVEQLVLAPAIGVSDFASLHRLLLAGAGIGLLPDLIARPSLQRGQLVRVLADWHLPEASLYAITLSGLRAPAKVRSFKAFVKAYLDAREPNVPI